MNRNIGASFALSVLVVAVAAVAFHQPETSSADAAPTVVEPVAAVSPPIAETSAPIPNPTPGVPLTEPVESPKVARSTSAPHGPSSAFTRVVEGESLVDVAIRVYGSAEAAEALWMANRDQVDRVEALLKPGMLLRTP